MRQAFSLKINTAGRVLLGRIVGAMIVATTFAAGQAQAQQEVAIGATVPITGPTSLAGRQYYNALKLAESDINKSGGINGKPVKFYFEDAGSDNGTALNAFVKVIQEHKPVFAFLSSYSTQNSAVAPETSKAKIPVLYAGGADSLANAKNSYMYRIRPADSLSAVAMVRFAHETLKAKKPGIIYVQGDFGQGASDTAAKEFVRLGTPVVGIEAYGANDKDMSAQLLSLKNRGADAFLVFTYAADGALLLHQMKQLSFKQPVVTSSGAFLPAALQLVSSSDLENVWGAVDSVLDDRAVARTFTTDYKAKFGMKADAFAAEYYDAAMLMAEAMRKVGTQPDKIMAYLATAKYSGVGAPIQFDSSRDGIHEVTIANCKQGTKDVVAVTTIRPSR